MGFKIARAGIQKGPKKVKTVPELMLNHTGAALLRWGGGALSAFASTQAAPQSSSISRMHLAQCKATSAGYTSTASWGLGALEAPCASLISLLADLLRANKLPEAVRQQKSPLLCSCPALAGGSPRQRYSWLACCTSIVLEGLHLSPNYLVECKPTET